MWDLVTEIPELKPFLEEEYKRSLNSNNAKQALLTIFEKAPSLMASPFYDGLSLEDKKKVID